MSIKTPIAYYGGKQRMLSHILPLIPKHQIYVEPFFGGGAVFFAKEPSKAEIVNDINNRLITFYKVLKYDFDELQNCIDETFHSRVQHGESRLEYRSGEVEIRDQLAMAWAVWVQANMSFGHTIGRGFGYDRHGGAAGTIANKKEAFTSAYQARMKKVTVESYDVLKVMKVYDGPDTFFYLDPPYVSSDQGHYAGYSADQFVALLDFCSTMQGKFLLSSYPENELKEYRLRHGWASKDVEKVVSVNNRAKEKKKKTECLTWNY